MSLSSATARFADFYGRHGLWATAKRLAVAVRRGLFSSRMVLFYCDLSNLLPQELPNSIRVDKKSSSTDLSPQDRQAIIDVWSPKLAHRNLAERFAQGALLWIIAADGRLAGYGWSLQGHTIEPHYYTLGENDVHLFDFYVFPQYRGRGLNPLLVGEILLSLAAEYTGRAFIEAAEWNHAQLSSLGKTPFRKLGSARKVTVFDRTIVFWAASDAVRLVDESSNVAQQLTGT